MKRIVLTLIIIITLVSCNHSKKEKQNLPDIKSIAGKSITDVEKILGKADKTEAFSESSTPCKNIPCKKVYFQKDKYEIIFINGKSDWITINNLSEYDFEEGNIELFGLTRIEPEFKNPTDLIRWKNIEGLNEINIFNDGSDRISDAYIKVITE